MTRPDPQVEAVAPGVRRVVAPNPGPMTERGTNTYLVGGRYAAVIDPGPADAEHFARIGAALSEVHRVAAVIVTHGHVDHSSGARALAGALMAPVLAFAASGGGPSETMRRLEAASGAAAAALIGGGEGVDRDFQPDRLLADEETLETPDWRLTALHTPGHLGDHICLSLDGEGVLFSGDHVMAWSTSIVSPPDGDMGAFMGSLERLMARQEATPDDVYLPGHGDPVRAPAARLRELYDHRRGREAQILEALRHDGPLDALGLVARIYQDLDPRLAPAAARNVLAHLIDLTERERAAPADGPLAADARFQLLS